MRRTAPLLLILLLIAPAGVLAQASATAASPEQARMRATFEDIERVEAQLEALESGFAEDEQTLQATEAQLEQLEARLREQGERVEAGQARLDAYEGLSRRQQQETLGDLAQARAALDRHKASLAGFSAALLARSNRIEAPMLELAGLAVLHQRRHDQGRAETRRILRMQAGIEDERDRWAEARETRRHHTRFSELNQAALHRRHASLELRAASLRARVEQQRRQIDQLEDHRDQLRELMEQFVREEEAAAQRAEPDQATSQQDREPDATEATDIGLDGERIEATSLRRLFWYREPVSVHAPRAGTVVFAAPFAGYRHLVIIDHGQGLRSLIGNLNACDVERGQPVGQGARLGQYQAQDDSRADPLHFEVRRDIEPLPTHQWDALLPGWETRLIQRQ